MKRTIFIWDVHGCYKELKLLIEKLDLQEKDEIYLTWDLINWWPKSYKVLKYMYKNKDKIKTVAWNNDLGFIEWYDSKWEKYNHQYSKKIFEKLKKKIIEKETYYLIDYIRELPLYIEKENFILSHAGIIPWKELNQHTKEELTNIRKIEWEPWYNHYKWKKKIIYGHLAKNWLTIKKNTIWLDSWCVYWKWLTAYILETGEIYSQTSKDLYINLYKKKNENKKSDK